LTLDTAEPVSSTRLPDNSWEDDVGTDTANDDDDDGADDAADGDIADDIADDVDDNADDDGDDGDTDIDRDDWTDGAEEGKNGAETEPRSVWGEDFCCRRGGCDSLLSTLIVWIMMKQTLQTLTSDNLNRVRGILRYVHAPQYISPHNRQ